MTYYLITDMGTQWFSYLISNEGDKVVEVFDMSGLPGGYSSSLLSNIYGRQGVPYLTFRDSRLTLGGGDFVGWSISELEFTRIKRMLELASAVKEFDKLRNSI